MMPLSPDILLRDRLIDGYNSNTDTMRELNLALQFARNLKRTDLCRSLISMISHLQEINATLFALGVISTEEETEDDV